MKANTVILSSCRKPLSLASRICTVALFSLLASQAQATSYDAVADFSRLTNTDTSTWSYRYQTGTMRDGNYTLLPTFTDAAGTWIPSNPGAWTLVGTIPEIGVNQTGSDATFVPGPGSKAFTWPNNTMSVHPGPGPADLVVLSWLSPASSLLNINFSFSSLDPNGGNGIAWFVDLNATDLSWGSYPDGGASGMMTLNNIFVNAGDRINFIVDPNGDFFFDSTQVTAMISSVAGVPDSASSLALLSISLVAMFAARFLFRAWLV
jgi:hypothetical protein